MKASPCTGVCYVNRHGICNGCLRSTNEIMRWFNASDQEQEEILRKVAERKKQL